MSKKVEVIELSDSSMLSVMGTRTVPPHVDQYGMANVNLAEYHAIHFTGLTAPQNKVPLMSFPAETDEEDEDSDMSLQFQWPKGPDVNYVPKNIAKSPTFILNAVIGVANKTTWAMIEQGKEKV
ncbi:hypothetical protein Tco_0196328 [Tanacetum coccineum]